jgi:hypothetical protein
MKKKLALLLVATLAATAAVFSFGDGEECSTLVASAAATADRAPLLWKNRDTDQLSNKIVFVEEHPFSYLALVNADDTGGRMAWAGVNSAGFAIANSVAYNLPRLGGEQQDLEGIIMADALRTCSTIADFEQQLKRSFGPDLGSQANFLTIDAQGGAAIFEVHNHGSTRLDAADSPEKYLVNTNFSRSGAENQGAGYLRFDRETALLRTLPAGALSHEQILQIVSRDLGHALLRNPDRAEWKKLPPDTPFWVHTNYTIDRQSTSAAVVFQGIRAGEDPRRTTMWVILGEPVTSIAVPLWVAAETPPPELWDGKDAPICKEALRIKNLLRPLKARERREYVDLTRLDNSAGTGWLPTMLSVEREVFQKTRDLLKRNPSGSELTEFERATAGRVLSVLQGIAATPVPSR